jgi:hypothetical protein
MCGPEACAERLTLPENPLTLVNVITEVPELLRETVRDEGLTEIAKSPWLEGEVTVTETTAEWETLPAVPVTVTT